MPRIALQIDMDGTALGTESAKRPHYVQVVRELTGRELPVYAFADVLGRSLEETVAVVDELMQRLPPVSPELLKPHEKVHSIGRVVVGRMIERFYTPQQPILAREGFAEAAQEFRSCDMILGLVTSAKESVAIDFTGRAAVTEVFHDVTGLGTSCPLGICVTEPKPSPLAHQVSARRLKLSPTTLRVAVEDSLTGVKAGKDSGAHTIYLHDQQVTPLDQRAVSLADATFSSWSEVTRYITKELR